MTPLREYESLIQDQPSPEAVAILGELPARWARMDLLSRIVLVELGRLLESNSLLDPEKNRLPASQIVGLVAGTRRGSLLTDLAYCKSLKEGVDRASPALFSYTLANICLAEAASHYGLTGPVYALFSETPLEDALEEAKRWAEEGDTQMIAGEIDILPHAPKSPASNNINDTDQITADFVIIPNKYK